MASQVDRERWETLENNEDWNERARVVHSYIKDYLPVLDIGAGTQYLSRLVGRHNYIALDSVAAHGADYVADLNSQSIPPEPLARAKAVTFLGVLEYLDDPKRHLLDALGNGRRVVFSYTPIDFVPDLSIRRTNGWKSDLSLADLQVMIGELNGSRVMSQQHGDQVLWCLDSKIAVSQPGDADVSSPAYLARRKIVLSGFFARGNAGDEALLQRIYETFSPHVDVILTVDRTGAYEGFWDWYPYKGLEILHQGELARILEPDILGVHVGGGGLPLGFNGGQTTIARAIGLPLATSGIDDPFRTLAGHAVERDQVRTYVESFKTFEVRTTASYDQVRDIAPNVRLGADWAFDLIPDDSGEPLFDGLTVVLRELPRAALDTQRLEEFAELFRVLKKLDIPLRLLPFCPEDERYLEWIDSTWGHRVERHWWNPRRCKEFIRKSRGLLSVGRLHPLIFAADCGTPAVAVDIDSRRFTRISPTSKIKDHADEFAMPYFPNLRDFIEQVSSLGDVPMGVNVPEVYRKRLSSMQSNVLGAFCLD